MLEEDIEASLLEVFGTLEEEVWRGMSKANVTKDIFKDIWDVAEVGFCFISFSSDDTNEERAD